jgi:hypothetical protein
MGGPSEGPTMRARSSSGLRLAVLTAAVLSLVVLSAGPVAADTTPAPDATFSQNGSNAEMYAASCTDNGDDTLTCVEHRIGIFAGKMTDDVSGVTRASQVCAAISSYTFSLITKEYIGAPIFERGCRADLPSGAIRFGTKLTGAALSATHLTVEQWTCDEEECQPGASRDVVVAATWTGIGPIQASKSRSSGGDGTCRYSDWSKGSGRNAAVQASFDGLAVGGGDDTGAYLSTGRYGFRSRCSEA